jgi:hypothetical protein
MVTTKILKLLPLGLATLNASVTLCVFWAANHYLNAGLLPIIIYYADFPFSICIKWLSDVLDPIGAHLPVDTIVLVTLGSAWYYLLGIWLRKFIRLAVRTTAQVPPTL